MYLQFNDNKMKYFISEDDIEIIDDNKIKFYNNEIPQNTSGFNIYIDNDTIKDYNEYTVIYEQTDEYIIFTSDKRIYSIYYIYDEDNFIITYALMINSTKAPKPNSILFKQGQGRYYEDVELDEFLDENYLPKYKVSISFNEGEEIKEIIPVTTEDLIFFNNKKVNQAKERKIKQLSDICSNNIINGINYQNKQYSYEVTDQNNLYNAVQLSLGTGLSVPYHADNETCELYSQEDIVAIYIGQQQNLTHNNTYYNQLKLYVQTLDSVNEIESVYYGQELTDEYLDKYNEIMAQAQAIQAAFIS